MWVDHKVIYLDGQILPPQDAHMNLLERTLGTYNYIWCDDFSTGCSMSNRNRFRQTFGGLDPARMSRYGVYYEYGW